MVDPLTRLCTESWDIVRLAVVSAIEAGMTNGSNTVVMVFEAGRGLFTTPPVFRGTVHPYESSDDDAYDQARKMVDLAQAAIDLRRSIPGGQIYSGRHFVDYNLAIGVGGLGAPSNRMVASWLATTMQARYVLLG